MKQTMRCLITVFKCDIILVLGEVGVIFFSKQSTGVYATHDDQINETKFKHRIKVFFSCTYRNSK